MPQSGRGLTQPLIQIGQVVVRIGAGGIGCKRGSIGEHGLFAHREILERHAQIEQRDHVVRPQFNRLAIVLRGLARIARFVQQAAQVHPGIGETPVELQRLSIGLLRFLRLGLLQVAAALVPVGGIARMQEERGGLAGQLAGAEVEEHLAGLGAPLRRAVADHDVVAFGTDVHRPQRPAFGQLRAQLAQRSPDPPRRDARRDQTLRGPQQNQVLKGEAQLVARPPRRGEKARLYVRPHLPDRQAKHLRDFARPVAAHARDHRTAYFLLEAFLAAASPREARLAGLRSSAGAFASEDGAGATAAGARPLAASEAFKASIRSMICVGCCCGSSIWMVCPSTLRWICSCTRARTSSLYFSGSNFSVEICWMICSASFSSGSFTSPASSGTSLNGRTSSAYKSCCITRPEPSGSGRICTRYCLPRAE